MARLRDLSSGQKTALAAGVTLLVCVLMLLLAEGAVRARALLKYGYVWGVQATFHLDETTGLRVPVPNATMGPVSNNSLGFRGPEIAVPKPPGRLRIAFLGGSTTYCAEVSGNDSTWPHLVAERLARELGGVEVDYVNGGVPGYGVSHSTTNLRLRVAPLQPDVIVVYHGTNDLSSNTYDLAREQGLVAERTEQSPSWLSENSLLWHLVEKNLSILMRQQSANVSAGKLALDVGRVSEPFQADLVALVEEAGKQAPLVVLVTFSTRMRRDQDDETRKAAAVTSLYYMPYMTLDGLLDGFDAYNRVIRETAASHDALLIEAADAVPGDAAHFNDSVHLTDAGAASLAAVVSTGLLASDRFGQVVAGLR